MKLWKFSRKIAATVILIITAVIAVAAAFPAQTLAQVEGAVNVMKYARARVVEVLDEKTGEEMGYGDDSLIVGGQTVKIEIISGEYKGREVVVENYFEGSPLSDVKARSGQRLIVTIDEADPENPQFFISSYERDVYAGLVIGIFLILILIIGRKQGLKTIVTLIVTMAIIFLYTIPAILRGTGPAFAAILTCIVVTMITMLTISGFNEKAVSAIAGTAMGVMIAGFLSYCVSVAANLSGLNVGEATMLMYIPQGIKFDFKELLFAGIIIGTMGASMDISMSVASSMCEVRKHNTAMSTKELLKSGLNVGKDVMGTMTNTLILAYTGSSMPIIMVFMAYRTSLIDIMNLDIIATEIVRSVAGSIGIILCVPCTALTVCLWEKARARRNLKKQGDSQNDGV